MTVYPYWLDIFLFKTKLENVLFNQLMKEANHPFKKKEINRYLDLTGALFFN